MQIKTPILVMGATGKTGNATVDALLSKGLPVRALARSHDARSEKLKQKGAEVFVGNMSNFEDMIAALKGIERAYFVAPWSPDQLHIAMTFAAAARASKLKTLVATSQWLSDFAHPAVATRETFLTDQVFSMLPDATVTTINVGWFADNYMPQPLLAVISQLGVFPFPLGNGKTAPISNEDIGRVIAAILAEPEGHAGKTYRPTGPELIGPDGIAEVFSRITGRAVKYDNIPEKMFLKALKYMGMHPYMQTQLRHYIKDYQNGSFERDAPNTVVEDITGMPAESFETIARRYFEASPLTKPTMGNKLKAIKGFLTLVATSPYNLDKYDTEQNLPMVKQPRFAKALL